MNLDSSYSAKPMWKQDVTFIDQNQRMQIEELKIGIEENADFAPLLAF